MPCDHREFFANVDVNRLTTEDGEKLTGFMADVRIECVQCKMPFRFIGLPAGCDLNSPTVSVDGTEGRFPILPKDQSLSVIEGPSFTVRKRA